MWNRRTIVSRRYMMLNSSRECRRETGNPMSIDNFHKKIYTCFFDHVSMLTVLQFEVSLEHKLKCKEETKRLTEESFGCCAGIFIIGNRKLHFINFGVFDTSLSRRRARDHLITSSVGFVSMFVVSSWWFFLWELFFFFLLPKGLNVYDSRKCFIYIFILPNFSLTFG